MDNTQTIEVRKCPACGGSLRYDARLSALSCVWCGSTYSAEEAEVKTISASLDVFTCPECGAQVCVDEFLAAVTCPYCGNNEVSPQRFDGKFEPDYVIPFSVTKKQAIDNYREHVAQKSYLPDSFVADSRIVSVQGTYVPFWLKDGVVDFDFTFILDDGKIRDTTYMDFRTEGTYTYSRVPADGSRNMADDMMDSLEPYDYGALEPFTTDCMPGFMAERYSVGPKEVNDRIERRVKNSALLACKDYATDSVWKNAAADGARSRAVVHHVTSKQAVLPVWLIVVEYEGTRCLVGVNGQTGKVAVNLPIDEGKKKKAITEQVVIDMLIALPFLVLLFVLWRMFLPSGSISASSSNTVFVVGLPILMIAILVLTPWLAYRSSKRKVETAMQNVAEATDAKDFDNGGLSLSRTGRGKGPKQVKDNWPV